MCFFFLSSLMLKNCRLSKQNSLYSAFEEYFMISVCTARYKRMQEEHVRQRIARDAECHIANIANIANIAFKSTLQAF